MRLTIRSNGKAQILEVCYVRESSAIPNLRVHTAKGLSQSVIIPDVETRNRVLRELSVQGYSYINCDNVDDVAFSY